MAQEQKETEPSEPQQPAVSRARVVLSQILGMVWSSPLGILGVIVTTASAGLILIALITDIFFQPLGSYQGLVAYLALPALFLAGLVAMPVGALLKRRALRRAGEVPTAATGFVIDLSQPRQQHFVVFVAFMTIINVGLLSAVSYQGYHYTESTEFCGTLCHSVMQPEYSAYSNSPHARVDCVSCHIGSGASWYVKSKLSGVRQVIAVLTGDFHRPIPTPIVDLRPARDTCEQCHWPEVFHGNRTKVFRRYPGDGETSEPVISAVLLHVGGRDQRTGKYSGIHWHVSDNTRVEYRALDKERTKIRDVRVVAADGAVTLYQNKSLPEPPADTEWRVMDCIDCHNRPSHIFVSAEDAIDHQLWLGQLDPGLPYIKAAALAAVQVTYPDRQAAQAGIAAALDSWYQKQHPEVQQKRGADIARAAEVLYREVYTPNIYPELNITWGTYPNHLGHHNDTGCYRCHNGEHETEDGETITEDCDNCHSLLAEEEQPSEIDESLREFLAE